MNNGRGNYNKAALILEDCPEASAAMSRRCLQMVLRDKANATQSKVAKQINHVVNAKMLPSYIDGALLHAIRHFGNFGAHGETDVNTLEVIPVEPTEAEWCLDVLGLLFDFYFVQPKRAGERLNVLNAKLAAKKKPAP